MPERSLFPTIPKTPHGTDTAVFPVSSSASVSFLLESSYQTPNSDPFFPQAKLFTVDAEINAFLLQPS